VAAPPLTAPHDTLTAALQIARNPGWNVDGIFRLLPSKDSSEPVLGIAPPDWTLPILTRPSAPVFLPTGGTLTQGQTVVISDETPDAAIYYTLDGSLPTANSSRYAGPITISASTTVTAAAIRQSIQSALAAATFSVALPVTLALTPSVVTLSASQSELFHATVGGASQTAVTYSLLPAVGTVSSAGLYTAPAVVNAAASVTLTAQTTDGSAKTAKAVINVIPGSLQLTIADLFLAAGSTQTATVTLSQPAPPAGSVVTLGSSDNSVAGVPTTVTVAAGKTQVGFTVAGQKQGHATVTATAAGFGTANGTLSVNAASIPKQFMGLNVGDTPNRWPTLQFGTLATNSRIQWPETNSGPGIYNFSMLDQYFQFAQHYGADIVFPLLDTPTWASSSPTTHGKDGPGECAPPSSMAQWDNYVRAVATYAGTNVKYWTVFNEVQDPGYWCGDVATLVMMVQHARSIIRSINPKAVMLSPTTTSLPDGPAMLAKFLAAGGGQYVDVIAFHGYKSATAEDVLQVISAYKQVLATAHVNLPVWDTEADWAGDGSHSIADPAAQGAFVAKYFLLHWSQGVSRFIWYEYDGGPWGGLVDDADGYKETLAATAYGETYKWLVGASMNNVCTKASNGTWSCGLARAGGYIATVMWNSTQDTHTTVPSGSVLSRDLTGVEHSVTAGSAFVVGNQPVLFENKTLPK
jgi:polysaccharide biosynthesis protein PslG